MLCIWFLKVILWIYRAGEFPAEVFEESPFYQGVLLQNGFCPKSNTTWTDVSEEARIIVRLHIKHVEKKELSQMDMKKIAKIATNLEELKSELSEALLI